MKIFDYTNKEQLLSEQKEIYLAAEEFPHIVIDDFLTPESIAAGLKEFPAIGNEGWIHYIHFNENKGGLNKIDLIPPSLRSIIDELNSPHFVKYLSQLTSIPNLIPDPSLEGGGLHQIKPGGFLNIHADFTAHPHHRMWRRRVNVLVYLNENWHEGFGGHLELWKKDMSRAFAKILPIYNRCVIFNTDRDSFHGHPTPLTCPENSTRKSIALYYFTEEKTAPIKIATNYRARPDDGIKSLFIYLDKKVLSLYNHVKGILGINDDFISKILKSLSIFSRKK